MKCAKELVEMNVKATREWEASRLLALALATEKAIEYCDTVVNDALEALAQSTKPVELQYFERLELTENDYGQMVFQQLQDEGSMYADGTHSFTPYGAPMLADALVSYLEQHCFKVEITESEYMHYGAGSCSCKLLIVRVPKEVECY